MTNSLIEQLSNRQLDAYNRADIDGFCACYHDEVEVSDAEGKVTTRGIVAFRERYAQMFATHTEVRANITDRMTLGEHVVEREFWSRVEKSSGEKRHGEIIVRYTERDGRIRWAQFFRAGSP